MSLSSLPLETLENILVHVQDYDSHFAFRNSCKYTCELEQADFLKSELYHEFLEKMSVLCEVHYRDGCFVAYEEIEYHDTFADAYIMFECLQLFPMRIRKMIRDEYEPLLHVLLDHLSVCKESHEYFTGILEMRNKKMRS